MLLQQEIFKNLQRNFLCNDFQDYYIDFLNLLENA